MEKFNSKLVTQICNCRIFQNQFETEVEKLMKYRTESMKNLVELKDHTQCKELKLLLTFVPKIFDKIVQQLEEFGFKKSTGDRRKSIRFVDEEEEDDYTPNLSTFVGISMINYFPYQSTGVRCRRSIINTKRAIVSPENDCCSDSFWTFLALVKSLKLLLVRKFELMELHDEERQDFFKRMELSNDGLKGEINRVLTKIENAEKSFQEEAKIKLGLIKQLKSGIKEIQLVERVKRNEIEREFCWSQYRMEKMALPVQRLRSRQAVEEKDLFQCKIETDNNKFKDLLKQQKTKQAAVAERIKLYDSEMPEKHRELKQWQEKLRTHEVRLQEWEAKVNDEIHQIDFVKEKLFQSP